MNLVPQLILTLSPQGDLIAELPGNNGSRRKLEITDLYQLRDELQTQREAIMRKIARKAEAEKAERLARSKRVYRHSAATKGQGVDFADKIFGRPKGIRDMTREQRELALLLDL